MTLEREMRTPDTLQDVEDPGELHVEGTVLEMKETDEIIAETPSKHRDSTIASLTMLYMVMLVLMCVMPAQFTKHSNGGFEDIAKGILVIFVFGGLALCVAALNCMLTVCRWENLSLEMKALGLFPTFCSILVVLVVTILVNIHRETDSEVPPCFENGCSPKMENETAPALSTDNF